jgi:ADP-ribose pyrophosphatase
MSARRPGWQVTSSRYLFESEWYKLRQDRIRLPGGQRIVYTLVEHPGYVVVVPLLDDGRVVMERVWRHTVQRTLLECPAGGRDGLDPQDAARRELEEETGYRAGRLTHLGRFLGSKGISDEAFDVYLADSLTADGVICREPAEHIDVELMAFDEVHALALNGAIEDAASVLALMLARRHLDASAGKPAT